jgi:hypothetical protein
VSNEATESEIKVEIAGGKVLLFQDLVDDEDEQAAG